MTRLYLIRHGETLWNKEKRTQGSKDINLSEIGRLQGESLAKLLLNKNIDAIYSSDLSRAFDTATIIGKEIGLDVQLLQGIREMNFGKWEGLTRTEIQLNYEKEHTEWGQNPHIAKIPDGETLLDVQRRSLESIESIIKKTTYKNIVVVSHGVAIKSIILGLLGIDLSFYKNLKIDNTGINIIDIKEHDNILIQLNNTYHLSNTKE